MKKSFPVNRAVINLAVEIAGKEDFERKPLTSKTAVICIADTERDFAVHGSHPDYVLRLKNAAEQAAEIAAFVNSIQYKADVLICHGDCGIGAGIAAAVRQFLYENGIDVFADERYNPNKAVYSKVFAALMDSL
jgi:hypothetical protein